jgi:hypothetical protein
LTVIENQFGKVRELRVLAWAVLWVAIILVACEYAFSKGWPWRISGLEPFMLRSSGDYYVHCAFQMHRIKLRDRTKEDEFFVFIGGSTGLEAVTSDALMEERLGEITGKRIGFASLCSSYKSFSDEAKIVNELGAFGGTLLIGIEALRLKTNIDEQLEKLLRTGNITQKHFYITTNPRLDATLSHYGLQVGFKQRFRLFRAAGLLGEVLKKKGLHFVASRGKIRRIAYDRHSHRDKPPLGEAHGEEFRATALPNILERCKRNGKMNMDLLDETISIAQQNSNRVVLVDLPVNPMFQREMDSFHVLYDEMVRDLVETTGVEYMDLRHAAGWVLEDFRDIHHMRSSGQTKFAEALARRLSGHMKL